VQIRYAWSNDFNKFSSCNLSDYFCVKDNRYVFKVLGVDEEIPLQTRSKLVVDVVRKNIL